MKKLNKTLGLSLLAVAAGALSSCGGSRAHGEIEYWSCFGGAYTSVLEGIALKVGEKVGTTVNHVSHNSYDKIKTDVMYQITGAGEYPNIVTGYPDHFAEYIGSNALVSLDKYLADYNKTNGTDLLNDYLPAYMEENYALAADSKGNPLLYGLPFNKSTELMGYNGSFVDYAKYLCDNSLEGLTPADDLGKVPATWGEWEVKGPKYRGILDKLCAPDAKSKGKVIYGRQTYDGSAYDFLVQDRNDSLKRLDEEGNPIYYLEDGRVALVDFTNVDINMSRVISWDSLDNMFITLVRQWGSQYTNLTDDQKKEEPLYRKGDIMFVSPENKQKTIDCLRYFTKLHDLKIFGEPSEFDSTYNSEAFEQGKVMFMLCSSGGLSYNTANWQHRFRVAPLPYRDADHKYVISQGADIALTDRSNNYEECFDAMVALTTGDIQAEWCLQTGYYPCSKSAINAPAYQSFLHEADDEVIQANADAIKVEHPEYTAEQALEKAREEVYSTPTRVAYREGSNVNEENYMKEGSNWHKFIDPAFIGSSTIRKLVKAVFKEAFHKTGSAPDSDFEKILRDVVNSDDIRVTYKTNIRVVE